MNRAMVLVMTWMLATCASAQDLEKAKKEARLVFYASWGLSDADYVINARLKRSILS